MLDVCVCPQNDEIGESQSILDMEKKTYACSKRGIACSPGLAFILSFCDHDNAVGDSLVWLGISALISQKCAASFFCFHFYLIVAITTDVVQRKGRDLLFEEVIIFPKLSDKICSFSNITPTPEWECRRENCRIGKRKIKKVTQPIYLV